MSRIFITALVCAMLLSVLGGFFVQFSQIKDENAALLARNADFEARLQAVEAEQASGTRLLAAHHAELAGMRAQQAVGTVVNARMQLAQSHDSTVNSSVVFDSSNFVTQDQLEDALDDLENQLAALIQQQGGGNLVCVSGVYGQGTTVSTQDGSRMNGYQIEMALRDRNQQMVTVFREYGGTSGNFNYYNTVQCAVL